MLGLIPEALEEHAGQCLDARTESLSKFVRLGPADLVLLEKTNKSRHYSAYHATTGVDVSSPAAVAARMNVLATVLGETQVWFGRAPQWKVSSGTYCVWNAFAGVDVRVHVDIPGSTHVYLIMPNGLSKDVTELSSEDQDRLWLEVGMSAFVRSLMYTDDDAHLIELCRREDPVPTKYDVERFVSLFEALWFRGMLLGAGSDVQYATPECNLMVDALYRVMESTGYFEPAVQALQRLGDEDPAARQVLARIYLMSDREVEAIPLMVEAVRSDASNSGMLALEAQFLQGKGEEYNDLALDCAERASWASPTDFFGWETLAKVYVNRGEYGPALLALNSAPLIASRGIDRYTLPTPKRVHVPVPLDGAIDEVWSIDPAAQDPEDGPGPLLAQLPGGKLGPATATGRAYRLLADIYRRIGWKALMDLRANVFWMQVEQSGKDGEEQSVAPHLRNKRLCERRLDNLFMALYEDSRTYNQILNEILHYESQKLPFAKSAKEWELFGMLAQRLGHAHEARDAYQRSLSVKFSHRILWKQLEYLVPEHSAANIDAAKTLPVIVKLMAWDHRWYTEFSPRLTRILRQIVAQEGLTMVTNELEAEFGKQGVMKVMRVQIERLRQLGVRGADL